MESSLEVLGHLSEELYSRGEVPVPAGPNPTCSDVRHWRALA